MESLSPRQANCGKAMRPSEIAAGVGVVCLLLALLTWLLVRGIATETNATVVFGHDADQIKQLRTAPEGSYR